MSIKCGLAAVAAALAALTIIGCATTADGVAEPSGPESAFVCGRIDLSAMNEQVEFVAILRYPFIEEEHRIQGIATEEKYKRSVTDLDVHVSQDGTFFAENVAPGRYFLYRVEAAEKPLSNRQNIYFPGDPDARKAKESATFTVSPGAMVYLGAYQFVPGKRGGFLSAPSDEFSVKPMEGVSRVDTLKAILPLLQGTEWHGRVQRWIDSK